MSTDYRPMWKALGLNLDNHDKLMEVLGAAYGSLFMSQKNRPKATSYLDFVMSEVHGLRIKEIVDGKQQGKKVVGTYCTYVPEEIVLAAGLNGKGILRWHVPTRNSRIRNSLKRNSARAVP